MADTHDEVIDGLVRLMNGDINVGALSRADLYAAAAVVRPEQARDLLARILTGLNDRGETFAQIGKELGIHEATAARWAKPPTEDRRKRRLQSRDPADDGADEPGSD